MTNRYLGVSRSLDNALQFQRTHQSTMLTGAGENEDGIDPTREDNRREVW